MDRRKFIAGVTVAGGTAALPPAVAAKRETAAVNWKVQGFTCVTCAVGLEVMLGGLTGVTRVKASWPNRSVSIGYDAHLTGEKQLRDFVGVCGFQIV